MVMQPAVNDRENQARVKLAESVFLDSHEYHTFNNVVLPTGSKTIHIDHVIVSRFGIFVVETKNKNGWIYGNRPDRNWTQMVNNHKYKFPNPLQMNFIHTLSLSKKLGINVDKLFPAIVFWGNCEFRTIMPFNVLNNKLTDFIRSKKKAILNDTEVATVCGLLTKMKDNTSANNSGKPISLLMKWFGKN